jgi:hypothetical protein
VLAACLATALGLAGGAGRPARADVVTTKDGKTYEGKVLSQDGDVVVIDTTFDGKKEVPKANVSKVDTSVPPLREMFDFRLEQAGTDVKALLDVADWARAKGFRKEIEVVWRKVVAVDPKNARAHKALGHVLVGSTWMTPEEKAAADKAAEEAAMRAKGLVLHEGQWVTPEDKAALEKGMRKDGTEWVTEEEYHQRRGEKKVNGEWIRVGEKEGLARAKAVAAATGSELSYLWGPHLDLAHEIKPEEAQAVLDAGEKAFRAALRLLKPGPADGLNDLRVQAFVFQRSPAYGRFVDFFAKEQDIASMPGLESWNRSTSKQKSFWWTDPVAVTGHYLFPNPAAVLSSNVLHNLGSILLNRYRFNYRFSSQWLMEGFAYVLELDATGTTMSFTLGKSGGAGGIDPAVWNDAKQWKTALGTLVASGQDLPLPRLAVASFGQFGYTDLVKSWSVVDFLVRLDAAKFKAFVDGSKLRDRTEEQALRDAYGFDYRGADSKWRAFVQAGFQLP